MAERSTVSHSASARSKTGPIQGTAEARFWKTPFAAGTATRVTPSTTPAPTSGRRWLGRVARNATSVPAAPAQLTIQTHNGTVMATTGLLR